MKAPKRNIPDAGAGSGQRSITVEDVMTDSVHTANPGDKVRDVRALLSENGFNSLPVVDGEGEVAGIVTTTDLVSYSDETAPVSAVMAKDVYTVPLYSPIHVAARVMRNHGIHHVVVTHEKKVVGIVSSFDLLKLVEDKRFVAKGATGSKKGGKRKRAEGA